MQGAGRSGRENLQRGTRKVLGVINMFIILFVVLISWVYADDKTKKLHVFKEGQFIVCQLSLHNAP